VRRGLGDVVARGSRSALHAYGRGAVVKVPKPTGPDNWMAEDWILCEARYAEAARAAGAPAARLLGIESIDGRPASVWERIEGETLWQQVLDRPERSIEAGRRLAELQLALFALVAPVGLPSQYGRLVSKIRVAAARVDPEVARAVDLIPARAGRLRLCHGDLHPSNVILSREGPVIVDWYDASRGDAVADVARTCMTLLGDGGAGPRHLPGSDGSMLESLTDAYLERLWEPLGLDDERLQLWQGINAVARMAEGLASRTLFEVWEHCARAPALQA
jgi:aminoglycoside phosphotransferase (APT) family kinase protein